MRPQPKTHRTPKQVTETVMDALTNYPLETIADLCLRCRMEKSDFYVKIHSDPELEAAWKIRGKVRCTAAKELFGDIVLGHVDAESRGVSNQISAGRALIATIEGNKTEVTGAGGGPVEVKYVTVNKLPDGTD